MPAHTTLATVPKGGDLLDSLAQLKKSGDAWFTRPKSRGRASGGERRTACNGLSGTALLQLAGPSGSFVVAGACVGSGIEVLGGVGSGALGGRPLAVSPRLRAMSGLPRRHRHRG